MLKLPLVGTSLTLAAGLAIAAAGCDFWPLSHATGSKEPPKIAAQPAAAPPQQTASIPRPVAPSPESAPAAPPTPPQRMSVADQASFDAWMMKTYLLCWKPSAQPADADPYIAQVRLAFKPDGSLSKAPKLVNPPSNPALKPQAKSALAAVKACNPLQVPAQYRPFYDQWRTKTIHFNPQVAAR